VIWFLPPSLGIIFLTWFIDTTSIAFSFYWFSFNSSIINLSVYPEQITGEHYCLLFFVFKMVDCSGGEFFVCQFYILAISIIISKWLLLSATKACRSKRLLSKFYFGLKLHYLLFWDFDIVNGVYFPNQSYQIFLNHSTVVLFWIPYFCRFCNCKLSLFNFLNNL
jgi:hypothetical protein